MTRRAWVHLGLAGAWVLLLVPTLLWWRESVLWVATISVYANVVGHLSAVEAARPAPAPDEAEGSG